MAVNFYDLCRVCTANSEQKINVFSPEGKRRNLNSKVAECLALKIEEKDRLPKVLCAQCVQHLESNVEFRNMCKKTQTTLTNWLNSATGGKVYVKDEITTESGKSFNVLGLMNTKQIPVSLVSGLNQQPAILQGTDLLNSIMQVTGVQQPAVDIQQPIEKQQSLQQYTITVDNKIGKTVTLDRSKMQQSQKSQTNEKDSKTNALEEFLKLKPNIKVTPIKKGAPKQQDTNQHITIQTAQLPIQTVQQNTPQLSQQLSPLQFQQFLQQQITQQWQQQQLQQQLQQLTQLQPQQITITAPTATPLTTGNGNTSATLNDSLSPCKSKKPKINFVLAPPSTSQTTTMMPQLTTTTTATSAQQPHIQLQFQPPMTAMQQQVHQQQQQQQQQELQQQQPQKNAGNFLSNLAPFLQQAVGVTTPIGTSATTMLSPNKCFLPITIKDENSDQQIVAHIDAKNFVFPTTYQLQMKLQPQIATVDGQPIMQLTPTSIPATLQLTPQALTNQTLQALLNTTNNLQQTQILPTQPQQGQVMNPQTAQQSQQQLKPQQQYSQPIITSQQIIRNANNTNNFVNKNITNHVATSTNEQQQENIQSKLQTTSQQKYKITQLPGNTFEITPTTDFSPAQQQQNQTLTTTSLPNPLATQYGGITVQRISTGVNNKTVQQPLTTVSSTSTTQTVNLSKPNIWNKQNLTISRIPVQTQTQHQQQQQQQEQQKSTQNTQQLTVSRNKISTQPQTQSNQNSQQKQTPHKQKSNTNTAKKIIRRVFCGKTASVTKVAHQLSEVGTSVTTEASVANDTATKTQFSLSNKDIPALPTITTAVQDAKQDSPKIKDVSLNGTGLFSPTQGTTNMSSGFVCNQCQRVFKKKEHLTQHVKLHAGLRPFKCTQEGCDKDFSRKEHLLRHLISHTGQKMFHCDVCQKLFSRKDNLNKHKRIHFASQNSSNYSCDVCSKSFTLKTYYYEHMAMHNKQESGTESPTKKTTNNIVQRDGTAEQSQQSHPQQPTQQIQIVQQTPLQQQQNQQQQIMHLQLPTVVTTQDLAGNTITITQSNDPNKQIGNHDAEVLNLPSHLGNFVQLGQTQFVNASTGEIVNHIKIDK